MLFISQSSGRSDIFLYSAAGSVYDDKQLIMGIWFVIVTVGQVNPIVKTGIAWTMPEHIEVCISKQIFFHFLCQVSRQRSFFRHFMYLLVIKCNFAVKQDGLGIQHTKHGAGYDQHDSPSDSGRNLSKRHKFHSVAGSQDLNIPGPSASGHI